MKRGAIILVEIDFKTRVCIFFVVAEFNYLFRLLIMISMDYLKDIMTKMENAKIMLLHIFSLHVVGTFSRALMIQNTEPIFS